MLSQRVLILADPAENEALSRFFEQFKHGHAYEVLAAANRGEAVSAMKRGRPDLIVLDPKMKELDGLQFLKQIRMIDPGHPGHHRGRKAEDPGSRRGAEGRSFRVRAQALRLHTVRTSCRARASVGEPERG